MEYEPLNSLSLKKSNELVSAKYKSTLLENQVMAIALTRIEVNAKNTESPLVAKLYPGELKKLIGDPAHIYRTLKVVSKSITGHSIVIEDGKGNLKAHSIVTDAEYINGVFTIEFNKNLKQHILGLTGNYTTLELSVLTNFRKNSSFRLYELLKRETYKIGSNMFTEVEYNIAELKFMIGLANIEDQTVKNAMARMGNHIDWDELYEKLDKKDRKYEEWRDFQKYVIKVAQEELKEKSNIQFTYEGIRQNRKMKRILFRVYKNIPNNEIHLEERQKIIEEGRYKQSELILTTYHAIFSEFEGHNELTKEDLELLLEKAAYDEEKVRSAIHMADEQPYLNNYMGWIIKCIENDYMHTDTIKGSSQQAKYIKEIKEDIEENKEYYASKVWEKIRNKPDFEGFIKEIEKYGLDDEKLEAIYTNEEKVSMYSQWKINEPILV